MGPIALLIASLIAAAAAGTAAGHQGLANADSDRRRKKFHDALANGQPFDDDFVNAGNVLYGFVDPIGTLIRGIGTDNEISRMRNALQEGGLPHVGDGISESDLDYLLDYYDRGEFNIFDPSTWGRKHGYDYDAMANDYAAYLSTLDQLGERPAEIDYQALSEKANKDIDAENAQILSLYDQMLDRSNGLFESEMANNNAMYNDFANQIQTNNAMATNAIAGSTRYEMDRARRNAIMRGASAAQQLTANINAQLGLQNRAAQQQLETSNQLASALLQQRQAAAQLRGDYVSNLNADTSRRASLMSGTAERKAGLRNSYYNEAESRYGAETEQWKDRLYNNLGDNPYAEVYKRNQGRNNTSKSTYGL